jgi:hypothetical protein
MVSSCTELGLSYIQRVLVKYKTVLELLSSLIFMYYFLLLDFSAYLAIATLTLKMIAHGNWQV